MTVENHNELAGSLRRSSRGRSAGIEKPAKRRSPPAGSACSAPARVHRRSPGHDEPVRRAHAAAAARICGPAQYQELKGRVHNELLGRLNLERLARVRREDAEPEIKGLILGLLERESQTTPLSLFERDALITDVLHEIFGLGPLEALLKDPDISDILVNRYNQVYVEREGRLEETDIVFQNDAHLYRIIERIVSLVGRRIDESSPMVDARLQDGSRVNAVIPPLALDGPVLSIRRFRTDRIGAQDLVDRAEPHAADARLPARAPSRRG